MAGDGATKRTGWISIPRLRGRARPDASILFLVLGTTLLLAAGYEAFSAVRSHRAVVNRVLADYAQSSAWGLSQRIHDEIGPGLEEIFHAVHHAAPEAIQPRFLPASAVVYKGARFEAEDPPMQIKAVPFAFRFWASGGSVDSAGRVPADLPIERIQQLVRAEARSGRRARRTESVIGANLGGQPYLITFSSQRAETDSMLYVVLLDSATLAPFFDALLRARPLLPVPLTGGLSNAELGSFTVTVPGGGVLYQSGEHRSAGHRAIRPADPPLTGLTIQAGLRSELAGKLLVGGSPASRLPLLAGLMVMALSLLVVAFRQLRREQALARLRSDFVASVSHELRTPLALQRVFLDMLKLGRAAGEPERKWSFDNIDRESFRLAHLVENVLQFSRAEQGQMRIAPVSSDLTRIVRETIDAFRPLGDSADVSFRIELEDGIEATVDPAALRQVLLNLLENAVKYGRRGQTIGVKLAREDSSAITMVDDEGPGIPASERAAVFEPFRRGASTLEAAVAGSGIGLSVVREIVRLHGGTVDVTDAPGGGARFRVKLPGARHVAAEVDGPTDGEIAAR